MRAALQAVRSSLPLVLVAWALVRGGWSAPLPILSDDQQRRLGAGEVIVLDTLPPKAGKSAHGGTAVAIVRAQAERIWRILVDYPGHTRYYPRVTGVEVLELDDRHALTRYEVGPQDDLLRAREFEKPVAPEETPGLDVLVVVRLRLA